MIETTNVGKGANENPIMTQPYVVSDSKVQATPPGLSNFATLDFYKVATQQGFARSFLFRIEEISNVKLGQALIYATTGKIPDRKINTTTVEYQSYDFRVPMAADYPDKGNWTMTFYCDKNYFLRSTLENWSKSLYNPDTFTAATNLGNYDIQMVLLEPTSGELKKIRRYKLVGCIPTLVSTPTYNVTRSGEIVTVNVTVAFQYIETEDIQSRSRPETLIDKINKFTKGVKNVTSGVKQITSAVNSVATASRTLRTTSRELRNIRR